MLDHGGARLRTPGDGAQASIRDSLLDQGRIAAAAKKFFDGLNYSNQRRLVTPIEAIKSPEARERRIAKTVEQLSEGRA